jgi:hypothetical protein
MRLLTEDALLTCKHLLGKVDIRASQGWVTIQSRKVLVRPDPEGRSIKGCPNIGATIKPCQTTLAVKSGYSTWIRVDGKPVCLDSVEGLTDGTPPGVVLYNVRQPGQLFVESNG